MFIPQGQSSRSVKLATNIHVVPGRFPPGTRCVRGLQAPQPRQEIVLKKVTIAVTGTRITFVQPNK